MVLHSVHGKQGRLTFDTPEEGSKDKENLITMVSLYMPWFEVLEKVGPVLELIKVDRGTET